MRKLTTEQHNLLFSPLPAEAVSIHPTKPFLSVISPIYVVERLNQVFGVGGWDLSVHAVDRRDFTQKTKKGEVEKVMCVVKASLCIPEYDIHLEQFGGNDNDDMGDAYKGAATDALTKIASYLGVGFDIYKGKHDSNNLKPGKKKETVDDIL